MPNWCENELTIVGPPTTLEEIRQFMAGPETYHDRFTNEDKTEVLPFNFNHLIQYPKEELDKEAAEARAALDALPDQSEEARRAWMTAHPPASAGSLFYGTPVDGFNWGGYEWCLKNWGTKWNANCDDAQPVLERRTLFYHFDTAWAPPEPIIFTLAKRFPTVRVTLKYWEGGAGYSGRLVVQGEETLEDNHNDHYRGHRGG